MSGERDRARRQREASARARQAKARAREGERQRKARERARKAKSIAQKRQLALDRTSEAEAELQQLAQTLQRGLSARNRVDWDELKIRASFPEPRPTKQNAPPTPAAMALPPEPALEQFPPQLNLLDRVLSVRRLARERESRERFETAHLRWKEETAALLAKHSAALTEHEQQLWLLEKTYAREVSDWVTRRDAFLTARDELNRAIDEQRELYHSGDIEGVEACCQFALARSEYPDSFPDSADLAFDAESKTLVTDYELPAPSDLPTLREVRYVQTRDEFDAKPISDAQLRKLYDDLLYQIALRTIHEVLEGEYLGLVQSVVFNGFVTAIDSSTGQQSRVCVLSVQAGRVEFAAVNLAGVDPKACFQKFGGVSRSPLHRLEAVTPLATIRRGENRDL